MSRSIHPVTMPNWGIEADQGTITGWHASIGQTLNAGDPLLDVETQKIVTSVHSPVAGTLRRIVAGTGETCSSGRLLGVYADADVSDSQIDAYVKSFDPSDDSFPPGPPGAGPQPAMIRDAVRAVPGNPGTREKMSSMRATIARRLLESKQTIPHYRLSIDMDVGAMFTRRRELKSGGARISVNDLLIRACALALIRHPEVNSTLEGDEMTRFANADICIAVATPAGLLTPVIRAANTKTASEIAADLRFLLEKARAGKLVKEDILGGTFTISNLGMYGVDRFDAIINPPQVAILAAGAASDRVVVRGGAAAIAKMVTFTLSCDHRAVDGAVGAKFLETLRSLVEKPHAL